MTIAVDLGRKATKQANKMLHNANIYSNSKGDNVLFFKHAQSSFQMLNTFEKTKTKKRNVIFIRIIIRFKCCFGELH